MFKVGDRVRIKPSSKASGSPYARDALGKVGEIIAYWPFVSAKCPWVLRVEGHAWVFASTPALERLDDPPLGDARAEVFIADMERFAAVTAGVSIREIP